MQGDEEEALLWSKCAADGPMTDPIFLYSHCVVDNWALGRFQPKIPARVVAGSVFS